MARHGCGARGVPAAGRARSPACASAAALAACGLLWFAAAAFAAAPSSPACRRGACGARSVLASPAPAAAAEDASAAAGAPPGARAAGGALGPLGLACAAAALCGWGRGREGGPAVAVRGALARLRARLVGRRGLQTGIVGLPNVGKSTLFNALCGVGAAESANYPFCTIDPNVAKAKVPDERLEKLAHIYPSEKTIPELIEYVDIAGLVKGASKGEGLGNKFLANIRETNAIVHMVRCFEDPDITHVDGSVDPARDIETINLELIIADITQLENRKQKLIKDVRGKVKGAQEESDVLDKILAVLEEGKPARSANLNEDEQAMVKKFSLITMKKVLYAANVAEEDLGTGNKYTEEVKKIAAETGDGAVIVSAAMEAEMQEMDEAEKAEYLEELGVAESGCGRLIKETYKLLGLRTYYTCGPKESRAWTIREGWAAPKAASVIHTDFEAGFIKAATVSYDDFIAFGGEEQAAKAGKLRIEGKTYIVQDGDVMHFRVNK